MAKLDLSIYGITDVKEILHNPSYEELYKAETDPKLEGYEKGYLTELGAINGLLTNTRTTTNLARKKHGQI